MKFRQLVCLLLAPMVLAMVACASGSAIVTGNTRSPIAPESVKLYLQAPEAFEIIGLVNASSDAGWTDQGSMDYAVEELKVQAAKLGANGVLLVSTGEKTTSIVSGQSYAIPVTAKIVQGQAIFVSEPGQ
ncbi:MAG: hypothetical protein ACREXY_17280 [Gammaproteobacteria bacterium]